MLRIKTEFYLVIFGCLIVSCGHQGTTNVNDNGRDVFNSQDATVDAGLPPLNSEDFDAGTAQQVIDAGTLETNEEPQLSDYPDSPQTASCSPQYPEDESSIADLTPLFIWESALGASEYKFELAKDIAFDELVFVSQLLDEPLTTRYLTLPEAYALSSETTYFWRIHSVSNNLSSLCTSHFSFQTQ